MRRFFIENEIGERIDLNAKNGIFLSNPTGLGINDSSEYADIGEGFYKRIEKKQPQGSIPCSLTFMKEAYKKYQEFVNWCEKCTELFLIYRPLEKDYYRKVDIQNLSKSEITLGTWMEVPSAFRCLTPWYLPAPLNLNFTSQAKSVMRYPFRYSKSLVYGSSGAGAYAADIEPLGHVPAALKIEYEGETVDPVISLKGKITGKIYGETRITGQFTESEKLIVSTAYLDSYVKKIDVDGFETDLLNDLDITTEPFFRIPLSEPTTLSIKSNGSLKGKMKAQVLYYFRSV